MRMQVNPLSQQQQLTTSAIQPRPKSVAPEAARRADVGADSVLLSERAKDLAARMSGKGAVEETNESAAAKNREAQSQVTKK
jgi:hypothetical protein